MCHGVRNSSLSVNGGFVRYLGRSSQKEFLVKAGRKLCLFSRGLRGFERVGLSGSVGSSIDVGTVVRSPSKGV